MHMKYTIVVVTILFSHMLFGQSIKSKWTDSQTVNEAYPIGRVPRMYDADAKVAYDIKNCKEHLYLIYQFPDRGTQMKMMTGGLVIQLESKVKPKTKATISFPVMARPEREQNGKSSESQEPNPGEGYRSISTSAAIEGFQISQGLVERDDMTDHDFTYQFSKGNSQSMVLKIQIPMEEFFGYGYDLQQVSKSMLKVETRLKAIEKPDRNEMKGSGVGQRAGGGGMGGPGGNGQGRGGSRGAMGGSPRGQSANRQAMFSDQQISVKVELATQE